MEADPNYDPVWKHPAPREGVPTVSARQPIDLSTVPSPVRILLEAEAAPEAAPEAVRMTEPDPKEGDYETMLAEDAAEAQTEEYEIAEEPTGPDDPAAAPDQALLEQLFFDAHGGPFDPVSSMDAGKMAAIEELLASGQDFGDLAADDEARTRFALQLYRQ